MPWHDDPSHPFAGILEKLKRAYESIVNINDETAAFFNGSKYPIMPDVNSKEWQKALDYHRELVLPKRFSVLSGEVVHHLRTCLDHVAWYFSSAEYRGEHENVIEFPVFREKPVAKDKLARYERKVKGIVDSKVRALINSMQPYNREDSPENDPICIIHDMDRIDKHRELTIVASCANAAFPIQPSPEVVRVLIRLSQGQTLTVAESALARKVVTQEAKVFPQIAFRQFGKTKLQPVVPGLMQLHEALTKRIGLFADLI